MNFITPCPLEFDVSCQFYAIHTLLLITDNDEEEGRRYFRLILEAIFSRMSSRRLKLNTGKTECIPGVLVVVLIRRSVLFMVVLFQHSLTETLA